MLGSGSTRGEATTEYTSPAMTSAHTCPDCGASYASASDSCQARFDALLALDHSRREPWGSRHGLAFAAYALQHPTEYADSLNHAWAALHRVYVHGAAYPAVFHALRASRPAIPIGWDTPLRPAAPVARPETTIPDVQALAAEGYVPAVDAWCRAALAMWGAAPR